MKDKMRDIAVKIVDDLVKNKLIKDCIDTNDNDEFDAQDIIIKQLLYANKNNKENKWAVIHMSKLLLN